MSINANIVIPETKSMPKTVSFDEMKNKVGIYKPVNDPDCNKNRFVVISDKYPIIQFNTVGQSILVPNTLWHDVRFIKVDETINVRFSSYE